VPPLRWVFFLFFLFQNHPVNVSVTSLVSKARSSFCLLYVFSQDVVSLFFFHHSEPGVLPTQLCDITLFRDLSSRPDKVGPFYGCFFLPRFRSVFFLASPEVSCFPGPIMVTWTGFRFFFSTLLTAFQFAFFSPACPPLVSLPILPHFPSPILGSPC